MSASLPTLLSAIQPTHSPHLGNYLGAIRNWVQLQKQYQCIFFAVDLHAITLRQDPKNLREKTYQTLATYLAAGIDPQRALLFVQSHVPQHAELAWVLTCFSSMGELSRMTQFKDKSTKQGEHIPTGLFAYPTLMAADILLYQTDKVPVGEDQKQHIEITRDLALRFNNFYESPVFKIPEPMIPPVGARIMSLQNPEQKMSKSDSDPHATIFLDETDDSITKKIKRAVTDSGTVVEDSDEKPGVRNLLHIQSAILGQSVADRVKAYEGKMYGHLKVETAEIVVNAVRPIREKANQLLNDKTELHRLLKAGAEKAQDIAAKTLAQVYEKIGFLPRF